MKKLPKPDDEEVLTVAQAIRKAVAQVVPGQAITKETYEQMGYGIAGNRTRNLTDDPMGYKPRPRPETPTT